MLVVLSDSGVLPLTSVYGFYMFIAANFIGTGGLANVNCFFVAGALVFNERITTPKIILLLGSTIGVFFIKDSTSMGVDSNSGYLFAFSALIFWSINNVIIKKLTKTEHSFAQLFYSSLFASFFSFPLACFQCTFDFQQHFISINLSTWPYFSRASLSLICLAGIASLLHKASFFTAYKISDISVVGPFDYLRLPFTGILSYLILNQALPNNYSLVGYGIIIFTGMYFIIHKNRNACDINKKLLK